MTAPWCIMASFPLILYPDALQLAWQQKPTLPQLGVSEPKAPRAPRKIALRILAAEVGLTWAIAALSFHANPALALRLLLWGSGLALAHSLWQYTWYHRRRRRWREQQERYEQQMLVYQRKREVHQQLCGELHHPMAIAQYQHQLVLAALQTASTYDRQTTAAQASPILAYFKPYLDHYFPNKIKTNLAIFQPGYQDFHRCELAYIDDIFNLFIDIEIDEPYDLITGHPSHCQNNDQDGEHNDFFRSHGWIVMRFSETQVVNYPQQCCRRIAQEVHKITIQSDLMGQFSGVANLERHPY